MNIVPKIKLFGVGSAGCSIVDRILQKPLNSVEYYVVDDDSNSLLLSHCKNKIQIIGDNHEGADYAYSQKITLKNKEKLVGAIDGADLVIIVAGLGGGMGSAATPIIAEIAREKNILSVAILYAPFEFEGKRRQNNTQKCLMALSGAINTAIIIPNEKAQTCIPQDAPITDAIKLADALMMDAINTIIAPITTPGVLNLEYEDVISVLRQSNDTFFGMGIGKGKNKVVEAIRYAINCPMAFTTIEDIEKIILYIEGGNDLLMDEIKDVANYVGSIFGSNSDIKVAVDLDNEFNGELKVSILGTKNKGE